MQIYSFNSAGVSISSIYRWACWAKVTRLAILLKLYIWLSHKLRVAARATPSDAAAASFWVHGSTRSALVWRSLCMIYFSITIGAADARNTPCRRCEIVLLSRAHQECRLVVWAIKPCAADLPFCFYIHRGALRTPPDIRQNEIFNEQHWILRMVFSRVWEFSLAFFSKEINFCALTSLSRTGYFITALKKSAIFMMLHAGGEKPV